MAKTTARRTRAWLKPLHNWTGIIAGLFLAVLAFTGSIIVFRAEFERASLPRGAAAAGSQTLSLDDAAREVARTRPGGNIRQVRLPLHPGDPYIFRVESEGKKTERVVSDASSGRVLGTLETGAIDWVVDLHRNFLAGRNGRKAVGIAGIVLFFLSATGFLMWLVGSRGWGAWISVRRSGSVRRFNFELHGLSGLWACAFLVLISFTGVELSYPDSFRQAVKTITGQPVTVPAPKAPGAPSLLSLEEYLRAGRAAMPDGIPVELRLPAPGKKGAVDLRLYRKGDLSPSGNHVYLDIASAAVIQTDRIIDRPIGARFLAAMSPIHYGQFGGMTVKIAWALLGLTPLLLLVTGLIAWWRPKPKATRASAAEKTGSEDLALAGR